MEILSITIPLVAIILYSIIGTASKVETIKRLAPGEIETKGWDIIRYEGFEYGSWNNHGGKAWYHVQEKAKPKIRYRICVTLWNNELQYRFGKPEQISHIEANIQSDKLI